MATVAELKEAKRADLDAIAVEQGIDPAQYSKADDLRDELLKSADDAGDNEGDEGDEPTGDEAQEQNTTTSSADQVVNDADRAADAAEESKPRKATGSSSHAASFDKNGQPVFGSREAK